MNTKNGCIFCSIVEKKVDAKIILENEFVLAFNDINPAAKFHALIIPKIHIRSVNELTQNETMYLGHMSALAKEIALKFGVEESGYRLVINTEAGAGQSVFHLHMHFLAGREFSWPPG